MKLRRFSGLSLRNLGARPQRTLLTLVGIVLGVGIVFGVLTLSNTMSSTFSTLFSKAYGAADLTITAAGGSGTFSEGVVKKVRRVPGVSSVAPRLSLPASIIGKEKQKGGLPEVSSMRLFGVEPQSASLATGFGLVTGRYPKGGEELTLDQGTAESAGLKLGDKVNVGTPGGPEKLKLVGLLRIPGGSFGGIAFGMTPLPYAQKAFNEPGKISGIAVGAKNEGGVVGLKKALNRDIGKGLHAERSSTRTSQVNRQFQGFRIALLFFAGTSLFVGAFLVFNALSMTVLERTRELGMLRALGSTRTMIARSVVIEAVILGIAGSAVGVLLGYGMARGLVYLFGKAFLFRVTSLSFSSFALVAAIVVGIFITALAALYPALRAGGVSPVEAMRARAAGQPVDGRKRTLSWLSPVIGVALVGIGAPWVYHLAKNLSTNLQGLVYASGIAGVIGTFLGVSLIIPALVRPLAILFSPLLRLLLGVEGRMAALNATRNRGRTALTAAALMVGISLVIAFSALGGSVLGSIRAFLQNSLGADYVVQPSNQNSNVTFSPKLARKVEKVTGVQKTTAVALSIQQSGGNVALVFGVDKSYPEIFRMNYATGSGTRSSDAFSKLQDGEAIVGKQLAGSRKLKVGSKIKLPSPTGEKSYRVAGILDNDVLGGGAGVYLSRNTLARDFSEREAGFLAIKAKPGSDRGEISARIKKILKGYPQFSIYSNAGWKAQIEDNFNRQYVFFYAIMGVSVAVSAFGVVNTLSMSVFERTREIGVLRAIGTTRFQIGRLIVDEGVIISLIGCLIGVVVGSALGYLFVRGSGAGSFEVTFYYPTLPAVYALASGLVIGIFAGLIPARAAARTNIVEAVQYE
ncbi:MAG: ABC transporter permease [Rubrobacteraceae bacterium]